LAVSRYEISAVGAARRKSLWRYDREIVASFAPVKVETTKETH
jgi:hypothetical protein